MKGKRFILMYSEAALLCPLWLGHPWLGDQSWFIIQGISM